MSFRLTDYIITPMDIVRGVLSVVRKAGLKDWGICIILISIFFATNSYLGWQLDSSLIFGFLLAIFLWDLDSRISIGLALACLVIVPFFLALEEKFTTLYLKDWAEQAAVWAYYFLVIGVVKQIWDFRKGGGGEEIATLTLSATELISRVESKIESEPQKVPNIISAEESNVLDLRRVRKRVE